MPTGRNREATWREIKISAPILSRAGKRVMMPTDFFVANRPAMFTHNERYNIVYFHYAPREVDSIKIILPPSLEVESLPQQSFNQLDYASYNFKRSQAANVINAERNVELGGLVFPSQCTRSSRASGTR